MALVLAHDSDSLKSIAISDETMEELSAAIHTSLMQIDAVKTIGPDNGIKTKQVNSTHLSIVFSDGSGKYRRDSMAFNLHLADNYLVLVGCKMHDFSSDPEGELGALLDIVVDEDQELQAREAYITWVNYQNNFVNGIKLSFYADDDGPHLVLAKDVFVGSEIVVNTFLGELVNYIETVQGVVDEFESLFC
jgi:hypothetical protein